MPVKKYQVGKVLQLTPINEDTHEFNVDFYCKSEMAEFHFAIVNQEQLDEGAPLNFQQSVDKEISGNIASNEGDTKSYFIALKSIEGTIDILVSTVHKPVEKKVQPPPPTPRQQMAPPPSRPPQQQMAPPPSRPPQQQMAPPPSRPPPSRPPQQRPASSQRPLNQMAKRQFKNKPASRRHTPPKRAPEPPEKKETFKPSAGLSTKSIVIIVVLAIVVGLVAWVLFSGKKKKSGSSINVGGQPSTFEKSGTPAKIVENLSPRHPTGSPSLLQKLQSLSVY